MRRSAWFAILVVGIPVGFWLGRVVFGPPTPTQPTGLEPVPPHQPDDATREAPPISVVGIPPDVESVLTVDFERAEATPWIETFRPKPGSAGGWGVPDDLVRGVLDAGIDRLTLGARAFGPGLSRTGKHQELRIIETAGPITSFLDGLDQLADEGGASKEEVSSGWLFRLAPEEADDEPTWIGAAGDRTLIISEEEAFVRTALARLSNAVGGNPPEAAFAGDLGHVRWESPMVLLRVYDRENPRDLFSPLRAPLDDRPPQTRPFDVVGIRLQAIEGEKPAADLDVRTAEPAKARAYYHELLGLESKMEEPSPPGPGWTRFRLLTEEGKQGRFGLRVLLLLGYHLR